MGWGRAAAQPGMIPVGAPPSQPPGRFRGSKAASAGDSGFEAATCVTQGLQNPML